MFDCIFVWRLTFVSIWICLFGHFVPRIFGDVDVNVGETILSASSQTGWGSQMRRIEGKRWRRSLPSSGISTIKWKMVWWRRSVPSSRTMHSDKKMYCPNDTDLYYPSTDTFRNSLLPSPCHNVFKCLVIGLLRIWGLDSIVSLKLVHVK